MCVFIIDRARVSYCFTLLLSFSHKNFHKLVVTAAGVICIVTSLIGFVGIVLNNRAILTVYNLMMWPCFGMIASIGYTAYRKNKWNIEVKSNFKMHVDLKSPILNHTYRANYHINGIIHLPQKTV